MKDNPNFTRRSVLRHGISASSTLALLPLGVSAGTAGHQEDRNLQIDKLSRRCLRQFGAILEATALEDFELPIDSHHVVTIQLGSFFLAVAPRTGLFRIDPFRYIEGVDVGFLYVMLPPDSKPGTPADFYLIRAVAPIVQVGETPGVIQLINRRGTVVLEHPVTFDTFSVAVPPNVEDRTAVLASLQPLGRGDDRVGVTMFQRSSNGTRWSTPPDCIIWDIDSNC